MLDYADHAWAFRGDDGLDRTHIPAQPLWAGILRICQLVLAFIILVLTAYAAGQFASGSLAGFGLAWLSFIWTLGYLVWLAVAVLVMPQIYNYWAQLGLEVLSAIWWLCTWAVLASEASSLSIFDSFHFWGRYGAGSFRSAIDCIKASAALGAILWVLFVVTLGFFVTALLSHRGSEAGRTATAEPKTVPSVVQEDPAEGGQQTV